jgi:hypothetical protein
MPKKQKVDIEKKYPAMSQEDIEAEEKKIETGKAKLSMELADVEDALTEYLDITDPIISPKTGKAIMWIRRPSVKELKGLIPPEMREYMDGSKEVPEEIGKKYEKFFYNKLAEMVKIPEHTAEQWRDKCNPWLLRLFWAHIAKVSKLMEEGEVEGF